MMGIVYGIIIAALLGIIYQALGGRALLRFGERPDRVIGARVQLYVDDGLEGMTEGMPVAVVQGFETPYYRALFEQPFQYGGQQQHAVKFSARHAGYPVSRVGPRGLLAINGELGSGDRFIGRITRV